LRLRADFHQEQQPVACQANLSRGSGAISSGAGHAKNHGSDLPRLLPHQPRESRHELWKKSIDASSSSCSGPSNLASRTS
jgi:hypothetical protein